jgi:hypothetical protein
MTVNAFCSVMLGMAGVLATSLARAEEAPAAPAPEPAAPPPTARAAGPAAHAAAESKMRLGITIVPMPFGSLKTNAFGADMSQGSAFAFGVMPTLDFRPNPHVFVGLGPSYIVGVKPKGTTGDGEKELDLMLRVGGGGSVAERVYVYGYVSPGFSIIFPPQGDSAKGPLVGFHAGALYDVVANFFVSAELGYQVGFQKITNPLLTTESKASSNFFQIGLGAGIHI